MGDLDPLRAPDSRRWLMNLLIGVIAVIGIFLSASWWIGSLGRFSVALAVSGLIGWAVAAFALRRAGSRRRSGKRR